MFPKVQSSPPGKVPSLLAVLVLAAAAWAGTVAVVAAEGDLRWPTPYVMGDTSRRPGIESSAAVDENGDIYVGVTFGTTPEKGAVVALTPNGGSVREKWFIDMPDRVEASPMLGPDGSLYIGCFDGKMYSFDKETKAARWVFDANEVSADGLVYIHSTAALSQDGTVLYFGVGTFSGIGTARGALVAIRASDGRYLWSKWVDGPVEASPVVASDGTIYVGSWDGSLYAIHPDGSEKWRRGLDGAIWASAAIAADSTIYVGSIAQEFIAVTPDNQLKWTVPFTTPGSPAIGADGTVFVGNWATGMLCALAPADGRLVWTQEGQPSGWGGSTPTVRSDGVVLYGGADRTVRAYDVASGDVRWSYRTGYQISACPVVSPLPDHSIYIGCADGRLYCLSGNDAGVSTYSNWPTFQGSSSRVGRAPEAVSGGRLLNLSSRGTGTGDNPLIAGFVVSGTTGTRLLLRAVGPTLRDYGIEKPMTDPVMTLWTAQKSSPVFDDWGTSPIADLIATTAASVGAFPLPRGSLDAADVAEYVPGILYSEQVRGKNGPDGVALAEIYDADATSATARLANLSTRGFVGTGDGVLIGGLCVGGGGRVRVLIRGIGPGLTSYGVSGALSRPKLEVFDAKSRLVASNGRWTSEGRKGDIAAANSMVGAFQLDTGAADCALVTGLEPGAYTVILSGVDGEVGTGLIEVYLLPY